jgi:hypothetical protein
MSRLLTEQEILNLKALAHPIIEECKRLRLEVGRYEYNEDYELDTALLALEDNSLDRIVRDTCIEILKATECNGHCGCLLCCS